MVEFSVEFIAGTGGRQIAESASTSSSDPALSAAQRPDSLVQETQRKNRSGKVQMEVGMVGQEPGDLLGLMSPIDCQR
jgi:hypothetical protein